MKQQPRRVGACDGDVVVAGVVVVAFDVVIVVDVDA